MAKKTPVTDKPLYDLIPSQQTMYIMLKYSIHKEVTQIPASLGINTKVDFDLLKKAFNWLPKSMYGIKPVFIYPLLGTLLMGLFMLIINPIMGIINGAVSSGLSSLGDTSKLLLSIVLAGMMAIDMGGPINKAAYVFGTAARE